jgi:hypothetical protein
MKEAEALGFGDYEAGNTEIKFVRDGTSGQWKSLPKELVSEILKKNKKELISLGYGAVL